MSLVYKLGIVAACTMALWVFPSFGTQGMGTLRQPYAHSDRHLFVSGADPSSEMLLRSVDRQVDAAIVTPAR